MHSYERLGRIITNGFDVKAFGINFQYDKIPNNLLSKSVKNFNRISLHH